MQRSLNLNVKPSDLRQVHWNMRRSLPGGARQSPYGARCELPVHPGSQVCTSVGKEAARIQR